VYSMKRIKPPSPPGLEAEFMGRDRGLRQTRDFAERSVGLPVVVFSPGGRGMNSWLRQPL
jgi:hypothetical protein